MKKKAFVTGMGVLSPYGRGLDLFWDSLINGKSAVGAIDRFDTTNFDVKFAAQIKNYNAIDFFDKKEARKTDPFTQYGLIAAEDAVKDADLKLDQIDLTRVGVITGSGIGGITTFEEENRTFFEKGAQRVSPFFIPKMIPDMTPGRISIRFGFKGPNFTTVSACASSSNAIAYALRLIQYDEADIVITGGSEATITPMGVAGFMNMKALSTRNDNPQGASRPFDADRDGFVVGEGSGILVLESEEHAKKRGAKLLAEVIGAGCTSDAYHITAPVPGGEGAARSMQLALADAKVTIDQVDYINAHGTSTQANDRTETSAIKLVFGELASKIAISSTKSMIGHLLGASGALELIATILSINRGYIHPTINYTTPDPECDLNYTPNKAVKKEVTIAISNSFGFGGHNVTLAVRRAH
jgi:3-oxoacyl-[acyl-carrier-protein] synthase II